MKTFRLLLFKSGIASAAVHSSEASPPQPEGAKMHDDTNTPTCRFNQDVVKLGPLPHEALQRLHEVVLDAAAQAAVGQLHPLGNVAAPARCILHNRTDRKVASHLLSCSPKHAQDAPSATNVTRTVMRCKSAHKEAGCHNLDIKRSRLAAATTAVPTPPAQKRSRCRVLPQYRSG